MLKKSIKNIWFPLPQTVLLLIGVVMAVSCQSVPETSQQKVGQISAETEMQRMVLRNAVAKDYMNPETHLKLAGFHYNLGNKVQAFYLAENARGIFGDKAFTPVFNKVASRKMKIFEAGETEAERDDYIQKNPDSDMATYMKIVKKYEKLTKGKDYDINIQDEFVNEMMEALPDYFAVKANAAKFYLKAKKDYDKALDLYIDLYFHDAHFYDWEYAEFRIKTMTSSMKHRQWQEKLDTKSPFFDLIKTERNPRVLDVAEKYARANWTADMVPAMFEMMKKDDHHVQTGGLHTLMAHIDDIPDFTEIELLLKSEDLVMRSMIPFLVVKLKKEEGFTLLTDGLNSGIELVQLNTIQALAMIGKEKGVLFLKKNKPENASGFIMATWSNVTKKMPVNNK